MLLSPWSGVDGDVHLLDVSGVVSLEVIVVGCVVSWYSFVDQVSEHSGFLPYVFQYYHHCNHRVQLTMSILSLCAVSGHPPGMFHHWKDISDNITNSWHQSSNKPNESRYNWL